MTPETTPPAPVEE